MTTQPPLKSILKKSTRPGTAPPKTATIRAPKKPSTESLPSPSRTPASTSLVSIDSSPSSDTSNLVRKSPTPEEARRIAIYHATLLRHRKNLELQILYSIEELLDFPSPSEAPRPASNPLPSDIASFKKNLIHFRPSDYDDLIEERNIINKCGYALCANDRKRQPTKAKFRVLYGGRKIVETKELERYCSDDCARRGLWIKVQLNTEPAWMRIGEDGLVGRGGTEYKISLLEERDEELRNTEERSEEVNRLVEQLEGLGIDGKNLLQKPGSEMESVEVANGLVKIVERSPEPVKDPPAPFIRISGESEIDAKVAALTVEGYTARGDDKDLVAKWKQNAQNAKQWVRRNGDDDADDEEED